MSRTQPKFTKTSLMTPPANACKPLLRKPKRSAKQMRRRRRRRRRRGPLAAAPAAAAAPLQRSVVIPKMINLHAPLLPVAHLRVTVTPLISRTSTGSSGPARTCRAFDVVTRHTIGGSALNRPQSKKSLSFVRSSFVSLLFFCLFVFLFICLVYCVLC